MSDRWGTYAFEFKGGLVSNLSPLQQGIQAPGTARTLINFEPSVEGGYSRILGYEKYSSSIVPEFGEPKVQGSGQSGTTLVIANLFFAPSAGDTLAIAGVTGTYTIASAGVSYDSANKRATLTLTTSLATSPADKAAVTFTSSAGIVSGLAAWRGNVIAVRNNNVYRSTGGAWSKINVPSYGTVLVNGGSQTGSSLIVDGLTNVPQVGDTFSVAGIELVYTVTAVPTVTSGGATISISPDLNSSPANDAVVTFLTANKTSTNKNRFAKYRIATTEKIAGVDGDNYPFIWDGTTYTTLNQAPLDVKGAEHIAFFKNQLFFAKGDKLTFTAPYTDSDFNAANGAGVISVGTQITGIIVFREQLIIFAEDKIDRLVGNTLADFVLEPITRNIGCVSSDTIQEVGSDVMFLGPDGLRLLSATDRIGDFNLAVVSKEIQKELVALIVANQSFSSVVINKKSQYRIFGYNVNTGTNSAPGILGTQLAGPEGTVFGWSELRGFKAYVADTDYYLTTETTVFANELGYIYKMESGNSFDGANISATFATPFVPCGDPRLRKTFYKLFLYTDPNGSVSLESSIKLDFNDKDIIQPSEFNISNISGSTGLYGVPSSLYGTTTYGGSLKKVFENQLIGSGFTVSLQFVSNNTVPPFSLDAALLEFATFDRR
jgi:hypothetical protein